ncbi:MAG TPA: type II secretion system protein [Pyrinomonadaceae bacterium]|nr:type II secretion system protein [Pyrinomonadaceae bacterium]
MIRSIKKRAGLGASQRRGERGYTLVALMALMTIILLMVMAAAPSARHQSQREREQEAIFRGEEVADAIAIYLRRSGHLPSSMDDLLEGVPVGVKKLKILRAEAAVDPLTGHDWKLVRQTDPNFLEFERAVATYAGGRLPNAHDPAVQALQQSVAAQMGTILDLETSKPTSCHEDTDENATGPFLGVTSRSECSSIIAYYGIERHDQWVFTPLFR